MAEAAYAALLFINPAHTAGQDLASDIVMPQEMLEPLCHAANDDVILYAESLFEIEDLMADDDDDDDIMLDQGDDYDDDDEMAYGAVWVWRKPRFRKG